MRNCSSSSIVTRMSSVGVDDDEGGGELVPLDRSLIDCSQSSIESIDPLKLFVRRRRLPFKSSYVELVSTNGFRFVTIAVVGGTGGGDDADDEETDDSEDEDVDCVNFRLHRDCPVSRNPLANGLLSIFSLVIRSFCKWKKERKQ